MHVTKVFGPPGTGKTKHLLDKLEEELAGGVKPERVAFLTFTVAARQEAVDRVVTRFSFEKKQLPYFKTLHSVAFSQTGLGRSALLTGRDLRELAEFTRLDFTTPSDDLDGDGLVSFGPKLGDQLLALDHLRRHRLQTFDEALAQSEIEVSPHTAQYFCEAYTSYKEAEGLVDFTDLLQTDLDPLDIDVVFVDEAQDLSELQWRALWQLASGAQRVYLAGDDDQAIFTWAGASPRRFIDTPCDTQYVLHQSWRVPEAVARVAEHLSGLISYRQPKQWSPRAGDRGWARLIMDIDAWHPQDDGTTFVLYRNHYVAFDVERRLRELGWAYKRHDRPTPGLQWLPAIIAYERFRAGKDIDPKQSGLVHDAMMPELAAEWANDREGVWPPWYEALNRIKPADVQYLRAVLARHGNEGLKGEPPITLSTVHASKGQERDHVVLMTTMSRKSEESLHRDPDDEVRVAYVAVTRARESLTVVGLGHHLFFDRHLFS